jgi:hypothetical protein
MFGKGKLLRDGAQAQALVLDKNAWDVGEATGETKACTYTLKVQFDDGSSVEITRRVMHHDAAWVGVGELLPVRYDRTDRTCDDGRDFAADVDQRGADVTRSWSRA